MDSEQSPTSAPINRIDDRRYDGSSLRFRAKGLFDKHYLDKLITLKESDNTCIQRNWIATGDEGDPAFDKCFSQMLTDWKQYKSVIHSKDFNESQIEDKWIRPIFKLLGWEYDPQEQYEGLGRQHRPDYFMFDCWDTLKEVKPHRGEQRYLRAALAVADAKPWGTPFDGKSGSVEHPSSQIVRYMESSGIAWGILTDGRYWRLYSTKSDAKHHAYYEIDVERFLNEPNPEAFRYFYNFFRRDAFVKDPKAKTFLDYVLDQGQTAARAIEVNLKKRAFEVVEELACGFLGDRKDLTDAECDKIYEHSLYLLFRIMFVFNCESKGIFDVNDRKGYGTYSLKKLTGELANDWTDGHEGSDATRTYMEVLETLRIVEKGDSKLKVHGVGEHIFSAGDRSFFKENRVPDKAMNAAILNFATVLEERNRKEIDFETLAPDHLGSIFEGLLEHKLRYAKCDYAVKNDKLVEWKELGDKDKAKLVSTKIKAGTPILMSPIENERKAIGAYYTPVKIVDSIISESFQNLIGNLSAEDIGNLKICDPASGSGHFLLGSLKYLETEYLKKLASYDKASKDISSENVRLKILKNCIFGVDINRIAVELTKFSLWLYTVNDSAEVEDLSDQIKFGDSLFDNWKDYDKNFPWKKEFFEPKGFERFDVIVGNPPWGADLSKEAKGELKIKYKEIDSSTPNSFAYFIGRCLSLSKGPVGLLLPDSILIKDFMKTRKLILPKMSKISWYQNTSMPSELRQFPDVDHDVCSIIVENNASDVVSTSMTFFNEATKKLQSSNRTFTKAIWAIEDYDYVFALNLMPEDISFRQRVVDQYDLLSERVESHEGIHTGNIREKLFVQNNRSQNSKPLYVGAKSGDLIEDYYAERSGWFVNYDKDLIDSDSNEYASLRDESIFSDPKVYVTRTGNPFRCFYDRNSYASNNLFSLQFKNEKENTEENLLVLSAIIKSTLANYMIRMHVSPRLGSTFIETKITHLDKLPLPSKLDKDIVKQIGEKVRAVSGLKAKMSNLVKRQYELFKIDPSMGHGLESLLEDLVKGKLKYKGKKAIPSEKFQTDLKVLRNEILGLESVLDDLVLKLYKLKDDELKLLTAYRSSSSEEDSKSA